MHNHVWRNFQIWQSEIFGSEDYLSTRIITLSYLQPKTSLKVGNFNFFKVEGPFFFKFGNWIFCGGMNYSPSIMVFGNYPNKKFLSMLEFYNFHQVEGPNFLHNRVWRVLKVWKLENLGKKGMLLYKKGTLELSSNQKMS